MFPEMARDLLMDYVGVSLKSEDGHIYKLEEVKELNGNTVTYKIAGSTFYIRGNVHETLNLISLAYERNRSNEAHRRY